MKIFLDSADIDEIKTYIASGFVDGVTTNPWNFSNFAISAKLN